MCGDRHMEGRGRVRPVRGLGTAFADQAGGTGGDYRRTCGSQLLQREFTVPDRRVPVAVDLVHDRLVDLGDPPLERKAVTRQRTDRVLRVGQGPRQIRFGHFRFDQAQPGSGQAPQPRRAHAVVVLDHAGTVFEGAVGVLHSSAVHSLAEERGELLVAFRGNGTFGLDGGEDLLDQLDRLLLEPLGRLQVPFQHRHRQPEPGLGPLRQVVLPASGIRRVGEAGERRLDVAGSVTGVALRITKPQVVLDHRPLRRGVIARQPCGGELELRPGLLEGGRPITVLPAQVLHAQVVADQRHGVRALRRIEQRQRLFGEPETACLVLRRVTADAVAIRVVQVGQHGGAALPVTAAVDTAQFGQPESLLSGLDGPFDPDLGIAGSSLLVTDHAEVDQRRG